MSDNRVRTILRATGSICEQLAKRRAASSDKLPWSDWRAVDNCLRKRDLARRRGWLLAAAQINQGLKWQLRSLACNIETAAKAVEFQVNQPSIPSQSDIYRDIIALEREFEEVRIDLKQNLLVVVTEPIELEDVPLGPFEIRMNYGQLGVFHARCYRIAALEPNFASGRGDVPHPHVQDGWLCEGDGDAAIQAALDGGRLYDFFLLVQRVLLTYNSGNPYIALHDWYGAPCNSCDVRLDGDEAYECSECGATLCDDCRELCSDCTSGYCGGCLLNCAACNERRCNGCLGPCSSCKASICTDCEREGGCLKCHPDPAPIPPASRSDHVDRNQRPVQSAGAPAAAAA
jgi:hypothetical protein